MKNAKTYFVLLFAAVYLIAPLSTSAVDSNLKNLSDSLKSSGLNANVEVYETANANSIAIYIPQIHLSPGSSPNDRENDDAVLSQSEIYKIADYLTKKNEIKIVMVEGLIYGESADLKVKNIRSKIAAHKSNREIMLDGAIYKLKADGGNFKIYGSENKETYEKSAALVRDRIYLKDRINTLGSRANIVPPQRQNNPYKKETNMLLLQSKLKQSDIQISSIIIDQRNKETADNFARALKQEDVNIGVLQFGAGHKEGLIKELQKQNLSVIVIDPKIDQTSKILPQTSPNDFKIILRNELFKLLLSRKATISKKMAIFK